MGREHRSASPSSDTDLDELVSEPLRAGDAQQVVQLVDGVQLETRLVERVAKHVQQHRARRHVQRQAAKRRRQSAFSKRRLEKRTQLRAFD